MNNDLISREALKEAFDCVGFNDYDDYKRALSLIDNAPTVEAFTKDDMAGAYNEGYACGSRENARPQGEWKLHGMIYYCSECGHECGESGDNFCGNCGVKMKGGAE